MGRLILDGMSRHQVAIIFDVGVSTLYKKFPASQMESLDDAYTDAAEQAEFNKRPIWEQALEED